MHACMNTDKHANTPTYTRSRSSGTPPRALVRVLQSQWQVEAAPSFKILDYVEVIRAGRDKDAFLALMARSIGVIRVAHMPEVPLF